ncbi:hypothetical protein D3C84_887020 [compost metagenome]
MSLAIRQGDAFGGQQHRGVVVNAVGLFGNTDHHRHIAFAHRLLDRLQGRAMQRFGNQRQLLGAGKAHQLGFRKHQQVGVGLAAGNGLQRALQVVGGIAVAAINLYQFDLHRGSLCRAGTEYARPVAGRTLLRWSNPQWLLACCRS